MEAALCPWEGPQYLIFSANVPQILYYALIPGMLIGLILGFFVLFNNRSNASLALFFLVIFYAIWGIWSLILFATNRSDIVMLWWSLTILVEPLIYAAALYLAYVFFDTKTPPLPVKLAVTLLLLPLILAIPTQYNLSGVRMSDCTAIEGPVALYFSYILEIIFLIWIIALYFLKGRKRTDGSTMKRNTYFVSGLALFLLTFSSGNIIGSFTSDWVMSQYGYFGMPIFIGLLTYLVVQYKAFNAKLVAAQAIVVGLIFILSAQLFVAENAINQILILTTLFITVGFGYMLVKSVKREIKRKEELQQISDRLAQANEKLRELDNAKSEFISIASHQLRTPLAAIKGFVSLLLEGAYGDISSTVKDTLNKVSISNNRLMLLVENLLNISRIEAGRIQYQFAEARVEDLIREIVDTFGLPAKEKGLSLSVTLPKESLPPVVMDYGKIRETLSNLVDNAIKYTPKGSVDITARAVSHGVEIAVSDTGLGIEESDLKRLFGKFERGKQSAQVNVSSTGLGLYVGKNFVQAHGGTIKAASAGPGKGATFTVSLPIRPPKE